MDLNETMEFVLEQQARFEAKLAKAYARFAKPGARLDPIERVVAQNNHMVWHTPELASRARCAATRIPGPLQADDGLD